MDQQSQWAKSERRFQMNQYRKLEKHKSEKKTVNINITKLARLEL